MRKIEFKGKDKNNNWVYGDLIHYDNNDYRILPQNERNWDILELGFEVIPETVGQYTGVKDKKGVEIYEGDIFLLGDKTILHVVEWIDSGFKGRQISNKSTVGLEYWQDRIEIIGNIHDNPQLLNK